MDTPPNPFNELYVTETIRPDEFVKLFSPLLVSDTLPLYQPGNVVLIGTQGAGKSMLLNLLKPEVRNAYGHGGDRKFPIDGGCSNFIGAGINITRSGAIEFGQRPITRTPRTPKEDDQRLPSYFGDFLNYWIVLDLIKSIKILGNGQGNADLGLKVNTGTLDKFARSLAHSKCWLGFLNGTTDLNALEERVNERIYHYRSFLNYNIDDLPDAIHKTKTVAGEPMSATAEKLWESGVVPESVPFFIRIDQYDSLMWLEEQEADKNLHESYRAVVHKMIGSRDPKVSYRVGTRPYGWPDMPRIYGTLEVLEELRNFRKVNLDDILARKENRPGLFPAFAEDVFQRRVTRFGYKPVSNRRNTLRTVIGTGFTPEQKAKAYARHRPEAAVQTDENWPPQVKELLQQIARDNPLSAKLGEAWVRQQLTEKKRKKADPIMPQAGHLPWMETNKRWWKKERVQQALLQIAAAQSQRMLWAGKNDVLTLSGVNILVFMNICQAIWTAWLRAIQQESLQQEDSETGGYCLPQLDDPDGRYLQDHCIQQVSTSWYEKIKADPGGNGRQRFIEILGNRFRETLRGDKPMSNPGENGFSLPISDLGEDPEVAHHLHEATAFGALVDRRHTPKSRHLGECRKWYLNPILSPYFQIPVVHTKEPIYIRVRVVRGWLQQAGVIVGKPDRGRPNPARNGAQLGLFG